MKWEKDGKMSYLMHSRHRAHWAIWQWNMDLKLAGRNRKI
jgi:hypothetical protein